MTNLTLTKIIESESLITFSWDPVQCLGYVFYHNGQRVSNTWDPLVHQIRFSKGPKGDTYKVVALGEVASGVYPAPIPENKAYAEDSYSSGAYSV